MRVVVDRVEGEVAVLEFEGRTGEVPLALLPPGASEGWVLRWLVERDPDAEASRLAESASRLAHLSADDDGGDFSL